MNPPPRKPDGEIADPSEFFDDVPPGRPLRANPEPIPSHSAGDGYDLEGGDPEDETPAPPPPPRATIAPPKAKAARRIDEDERRDEPPSRSITESAVSSPWNRMGEWGPTLIAMGAIAAGTAVMVNLVYGAIGFGAASLVLLVGGAAFVAISYPIAITLERPVRMTPEQALKDYYGAASHHYPQYRRMWMLLSDPGKASREFDSFATFRTYWKHRMGRIRGSSIKASTPLNFVVSNFKGDKSAGKSFTEGSYSLAIGPRGGEATTSATIEASFVKGPDGMWYLDQGTIPESPSPRR